MMFLLGDPLCTLQDGLKKYITDALRKSEQKLQERRRDTMGGGNFGEAMLGYEFHLVISG